MPLFHLSAAPIVLAPMLVGGTTVLANEFHPSEVWDDVRAHGAVGFVGAGAMVSMLQNLPRIHVTPSCRCGSSPPHRLARTPTARSKGVMAAALSRCTD
ncbi:AMP-binding enzyme domain protein [Mycobacterium kansasii 824]|nr:AMP-binding enzyme domain protein [Mycobacterium kansasii 824]